MIKYLKGNIFESNSQVIVNTVNTVGVMGKGLALQFKKNFPHNFKIYSQTCKGNKFNIGQLLIVEDSSLIYGEKIIINFPTKMDWKRPSEYSYIEQGLNELRKVIIANKYESIAIPPLGVGNGGLNWIKVRELIEKYLANLDCNVFIYEPNQEITETLEKEKVKLTTARSMLLYVLYDLVREGEFVTEFACEKICYFLQRFGAEDIFKLDYKPYFYGPYSGKVRHVLYYLNGSYIGGYSDKNKKPFDELNLFFTEENKVAEFLDKDPLNRDIAEKTMNFLSGFYGNFGLELLSTLDFIINSIKSKDINLIKTELGNWSHRKSALFSNDEFIKKGIAKLESAQLI